jgi:hypothetical protein
LISDLFFFACDAGDLKQAACGFDQLCGHLCGTP